MTSQGRIQDIKMRGDNLAARALGRNLLINIHLFIKMRGFARSYNTQMLHLLCCRVHANVHAIRSPTAL